MLHHLIQTVIGCSAFAFTFTRHHWTRLVLIRCICSFSNRSAIYLTMRALWPLLCSWQSGVCISTCFLHICLTLLHFDLHSLNCQLCGFVFCFFSHSLPWTVEETQSQTCLSVEGVWLVWRGGTAFCLTTYTKANTKTVEPELILYSLDFYFVFLSAPCCVFLSELGFHLSDVNLMKL